MASPFKTFMHSTWVSSLHYFKDYAETKLLKICRMTIFKSCCTHCFSVFWEPHHFGICAKLLSMRTQNFKKAFLTRQRHTQQKWVSCADITLNSNSHFSKRGKWKIKREREVHKNEGKVFFEWLWEKKKCHFAVALWTHG